MRVLLAGEATRNRFVAFWLDPSSANYLWTRVLRKAKSQTVPAAHLALAVLSYAAAVAVASEGRGSAWVAEVLRETIVIVVFFRVVGMVWTQLHRRSLRYANSLDLVAIFKAVFTGSTIIFAITTLLFAQLSVPAATFVIDGAFLAFCWCGLHFGRRIVHAWNAATRKSGKPVVIVGAGDAAASVLKELSADSDARCRAVAIVDDDPHKWNRSICGVPVKGGTKDLARIAVEKNAAEILVCVPSAKPGEMREILKACRESNLPVRTLPSIGELVDGKASHRDFRRPRVEDLLQRDGIELDARETHKIVGGKTILVTGAGGSIGSELCRQIAVAGPRKLLLLDHSENSLFYAHLEAREHLHADLAIPLLMDLLQADCLCQMMRREKPDIVFHAAAHKHVGLLEMHAHEAIRNNVLGTRNLAEAALECGTKRFVNVSTDKAVNPQNYMGLSKKLTELCIQELALQTGARFSNVRFGNVAGSTGSVLRLFWDQIQKGGPIRVTDPRATRYFMTIPEAVHLILRAAAMSVGGEAFVFDMGEPVNIYELARTMMLFAGLKPGEDVRVEFTGLKPGEKVAEELCEKWEHATPTTCPQIFAIREKNPASHGILEKIGEIERFLARGDHRGLLTFVEQVIPEFRPASPQVKAIPLAVTAAPLEAA